MSRSAHARALFLVIYRLRHHVLKLGSADFWKKKFLIKKNLFQIFKNEVYRTGADMSEFWIIKEASSLTMAASTSDAHVSKSFFVNLPFLQFWSFVRRASFPSSPLFILPHRWPTSSNERKPTFYRIYSQRWERHLFCNSPLKELNHCLHSRTSYRTSF